MYVPVHQVRCHWQYRQPIRYLDVILPHGWHLGPHRIQLLAVPPVGAGHTKKVWRRSELLTTSSIRIELSQLGGLVCIEDEEERRRGVQVNPAITPPPSQRRRSWPTRLR